MKWTGAVHEPQPGFKYGTLGCAPDHLEAVTQAQNVGRGRKGELFTHCKNGHEMTVQNTYHRKDRPGRQCRRCKADRERERQRRFREATVNVC